jgi:hypothetical protein
MRKEYWWVIVVLAVALGLWFVVSDDVMLSPRGGEVLKGYDSSGQARYDPTGGSNLKKPGDSADPNAVPSQFDGFCYDTVTNSRVNIMEERNFLEKNCRIKVDGCIGLIDEGSLNDPADLIPCVGGDCYLFSDCDNGEECCSGATTGSCYKSASGIIGPIDSSIYEVCCDGRLHPYNEGYSCCGSDYYLSSEMARCCGDEIYNPEEKVCCPSGESGTYSWDQHACKIFDGVQDLNEICCFGSCTDLGDCEVCNRDPLQGALRPTYSCYTAMCCRDQSNPYSQGTCLNSAGGCCPDGNVMPYGYVCCSQAEGGVCPETKTCDTYGHCCEIACEYTNLEGSPTMCCKDGQVGCFDGRCQWCLSDSDCADGKSCVCETFFGDETHCMCN